jgi:hypothetical protein
MQAAAGTAVHAHTRLELCMTKTAPAAAQRDQAQVSNVVSIMQAAAGTAVHATSALSLAGGK